MRSRQRVRVLLGACSWARRRGDRMTAVGHRMHTTLAPPLSRAVTRAVTRAALELSGGRQARGRKASSTLAGARSVGGLCVCVRACVCVIWLVCEGENPWAPLGDCARDAALSRLSSRGGMCCMWGGTGDVRLSICIIHSRGKGVERVESERCHAHEAGSEWFLLFSTYLEAGRPSVIAFTV